MPLVLKGRRLFDEVVPSQEELIDCLVGTVHHIAFRVPDEETERAVREEVVTLGNNVTPVLDRKYSRSIYFREPGGVLFEIATDGPGFATDEPVAALGEKLALPPFLEPRRAEIQAGLRPLPPVASLTSVGD